MDPELTQYRLPVPGVSKEQYFAEVEEQWNKRIDHDVKVLGQGLEVLITDFHTGLTPTTAITEQSHLSSQIHTSQILSSAQNLLALTHQLKLAVILSNEDSKVLSKAEEERRLWEEREKAVKEVEERLREVARGA